MRNLGQFPSADELSMMLKEIDIDGEVIHELSPLSVWLQLHVIC